MVRSDATKNMHTWPCEARLAWIILIWTWVTIFPPPPDILGDLCSVTNCISHSYNANSLGFSIYTFFSPLHVWIWFVHGRTDSGALGIEVLYIEVKQEVGWCNFSVWPHMIGYITSKDRQPQCRTMKRPQPANDRLRLFLFDRGDVVWNTGIAWFILNRQFFIVANDSTLKTQWQNKALSWEQRCVISQFVTLILNFIGYVSLALQALF